MSSHKKKSCSSKRTMTKQEELARLKLELEMIEEKVRFYECIFIYIIVINKIYKINYFLFL